MQIYLLFYERISDLVVLFCYLLLPFATLLLLSCQPLVSLLYGYLMGSRWVSDGYLMGTRQIRGGGVSHALREPMRCAANLGYTICSILVAYPILT